MTALVASALLILGLVGCTEGTEGPEAGADVQDIQDDFAAFQEDFTALEERVTALEGEVGAETDAGVDVGVEDDAEVFENPESFVGQQVTVSAEVESVVDTHSFTLDGPQGPLLVVNATGSGESELVEDGSVVQVTGTVRESFSVTDVEQEFGLELDDGLYSEYGDENYIVADNVTEPATTDDG